MHRQTRAARRHLVRLTLVALFLSFQATSPFEDPQDSLAPYWYS